jgi:hypothetical protein
MTTAGPRKEMGLAGSTSAKPQTLNHHLRIHVYGSGQIVRRNHDRVSSGHEGEISSAGPATSGQLGRGAATRDGEGQHLVGPARADETPSPSRSSLAITSPSSGDAPTATRSAVTAGAVCGSGSGPEPERRSGSAPCPEPERRSASAFLDTRRQPDMVPPCG